MEPEEDANAWLYVRGESSIRITRTPGRPGVLTFGPGAAHDRYDFGGAAELEEFLDSYRQRLVRDGWTLAAVSERRRTERDVPPQEERRLPHRSKAVRRDKP